MTQEHMNIVFVGHVDHGKSTLLGHLLAETGSLPEGKLEKLKHYCEINSKPFEYAFLLDALADEQAQGITIDIARCFFKTKHRKYLLLDAPGHSEFLKNLVTGAAHAEAAFLVIDAQEGIQENSRRHAYLLSLLGIKQIVVLINKIDLVGYEETVFTQLRSKFLGYLKKVNVEPLAFIPVSGRVGDNIVTLSTRTPWYHGNTLLTTLDGFHKQIADERLAFRMPVQDVYRFTKDHDNRRIVAGQITTGQLKVGDKIVFYPFGKTSTVKTIETFNTSPYTTVSAGHATGFTLTEQIYIKRGDVACIENQLPPQIASTLKVSLFWLGQHSLQLGKTYWLKLATSKTKVTIKKIITVLDPASLTTTHSATEVKAMQVAECMLKTYLPIAYDPIQLNPLLNRFVLIDHYDIAGGGIIQSHIEDDKTKLQTQLHDRNIKWIESDIALEEREHALNQQSQLIIITGDCAPELRKDLARSLERQLFSQGIFTYFIGIGNIKHALESVTKLSSRIEEESLRQFSEVLNILLSTGLIVIATAAHLTEDHIALIKMTTSHTNIKTFWLSETLALSSDFIHLDPQKSLAQLLLELQAQLKLIGKFL